MLETTITLLAIICAASISAMSLMRWRGTTGFKAVVHVVFAVFAGLVALLNVSALVAGGDTFIRTATVAYLGFATAAVLPAARALGNLTYEKPSESEGEDAAV